MNTVTEGCSVKVHYKGTFSDGIEFDSSYSRNEALAFTVGKNQMISGFEEAVIGMKVGDTKNIELKPDSAYGEINEAAFKEFNTSDFPEEVELIEDAYIQGRDEEGNPLLARVKEIKDDKVTLDFNHPMAGKTLNFEIKLVELLSPEN